MVLDMAMGGSTNTVLHILAIAHEAGVPFSLDRIDDLSKKTPNICKVSPSSRYHVEDVARAGGIHTILGEVARGCPGLLDLTCTTVTGKTLGENIDDYDVRRQGRAPPPRLLTRVRAGGERTSQAWTVPSVAAEAALPGRRAGRARGRGRDRRRRTAQDLLGNGPGTGPDGNGSATASTRST